jgi:hypothetical protein
VAQQAARRAPTSPAAAPRWAAGALLVSSLLLLSCFMAWEVPRISHIDGRRTDFTETLIALRDFAAGADPYSNDVAIKMDRALGIHAQPPPSGGRYESTFNYLLPPALVFLPVLAVDTDSATIVVRAITVALYLAALALLVWRFAGTLPTWAQGGLLLAGVGWWPFLAVILPIVQQAGSVFGLLVLAAYCMEQKRWFAAGFMSFLALFKPTESVMLIAVLALWALRSPSRQAWRYFAGFAAIGVPTTLLAFAVRPTWVMDWWHAAVTLHGSHFGHEVDLPDALAALLHLPAALIWAAAAVLGIVLAAACWRSMAVGARLARVDRLWWWLAAAAVLSLLVVPRAGTYDMVIGLIAWFVALRAASSLAPTAQRVAYLLLCLLLLSVGLLAYRDHAALEFPVWALGLSVALWLCRREAFGLADSPPVPQAVAATALDGR